MMQPKWKSREEIKKEKELDEARKAGTALPLTDEEGNDISPHIPQYIAVAPWYFKNETPTLTHQRIQQKKEYDKLWYNRGAKGEVAKKFRPGCCENCGAKGHEKKDCMDRPRSVGAKFTNKNIKADDLEMPKLNLGYDGSRDRWNGYDPNDHIKVYELHKKIDEERKKKRQEEAKHSVSEDSNANDKEKEKEKEKAQFKTPAPKSITSLLEDEDDDEETKDEDDGVLEKGDEEQVGSKLDGRTRTTIRNLRIREDTAKYLINLDPNSAFYDPKTRSMRGNPLPNKDPRELDFAGENFIRKTGAAKEFTEMELFTYKSYESGRDDVHLQAAPSQLEKIYKEDKTKLEKQQKEEKEKILSKYGGEEHLKAVPKSLLLGQTEQYVEYSADGKVIKGAAIIPRSKWAEDVFLGNHTAIWGSYWRDGRWGFQCCWQFEKNSYCTGDSGKKAMTSVASNSSRDEDTTSNTFQPEKKIENVQLLKKDDMQLNDSLDERKRKYNSFAASNDISEEDVEQYHKRRLRDDDPMKDFIN